MSTGQTWQTTSTDADATLSLAAAIGQRLRGGEAIELISDLGGGKTTFVRGLAKGLGSKDAVSSPSFTLSNVYKTDELEIHHFDFYRLNEAGIMRDELAEVLQNIQAITVVEWGDVVADVLPRNRVSVNIKVLSEARRQFIFEYPASLSYLFPDST